MPHTMPNTVQPRAVLARLNEHSATGVYVPAISINTEQWSITCITFFAVSGFKPWYTLDIVYKRIIEKPYIKALTTS